MRPNESRQKMKEALRSLLAGRNIASITVKDICVASGYHRSTFYDNYGTIYDLYRDLHFDAFDEIFDVMRNTFAAHYVQKEEMLRVIDVYERPSLLNFLLTLPGNDPLFDTYLLAYFEEHLNLQREDFVMWCRFRSQAIGGICAIRDWLTAGKPCSREDLAKIILGNGALRHGLHGFGS